MVGWMDGYIADAPWFDILLFNVEMFRHLNVACKCLINLLSVQMLYAITLYFFFYVYTVTTIKANFKINQVYILFIRPSSLMNL